MSEALAEHPAPPPPRFVADLDTLIRARYPLIYLVSWEEQRLDGILQDLAVQHGKVLFAWSVTRGLRRVGGARAMPQIEPQKSPAEMLSAIGKLGEPSLVVLKDFHPFLGDASVVRALRELAHDLKSTYTTVILLSPVMQIPVELEKEISVLDVPLPGFRDLYQLLREIVTVVRQGNKATVDLSREQAEQLIKAAQGLTLAEAENAFAKAIAADGMLNGQDIKLVLEEKRQVIRKSGLLEFVTVEEGLESVGGADMLKQWLGNRAVAFGEPAHKFGIPSPKGLLLLGVQGCGKSLTAKVIANQWGLPLLRLDMGRIFSTFIGSSEENLRKAIRVAESVAPAVLWVDEIEKGLSGTASSGVVDGGVTARVFGAMLTWMQEKTAPVFVVATANKIDLLPPELLRKGRFDEIFFIDLPASAERREIWSIHLARRKRNPASFDLAELAQISEGYSGSEIEQAVISGLHFAFAEGVELSQKHLVRAVRETIPLATTMGEEIARLREWAKTRARPASGRLVPPKVA
ncbi:MAG TPA: AAA family ATPase [Myxococcales bacterium]|nr:AAA family ATPase [Myxococcales bacterium]